MGFTTRWWRRIEERQWNVGGNPGPDLLALLDEIDGWPIQRPPAASPDVPNVLGHRIDGSKQRLKSLDGVRVDGIRRRPPELYSYGIVVETS